MSPVNPLLDMSQASAFPQIHESKITNARTASPDHDQNAGASLPGDVYFKGVQAKPGTHIEKVLPTSIEEIINEQIEKNNGIDKKLGESKDRASVRPRDGSGGEIKGMYGAIGLGNATSGSFQNLG